MTTEDPDVLRHEIEHTQRTITADVNALTEKVTPSKVVRRRTDRARQHLNDVRDRVMGSASNVADTAAEQASTVANAVSQAPRAIRRGTEGNPMAAGLIAFGVGWLAASFLPATKAEQHAAQQVTDGLSEPVHQAADAVRSTVQDVTEHAKDAIHQ